MRPRLVRESTDLQGSVPLTEHHVTSGKGCTLSTAQPLPRPVPGPGSAPLARPTGTSSGAPDGSGTSRTNRPVRSVAGLVVSVSSTGPADSPASSTDRRTPRLSTSGRRTRRAMSTSATTRLAAVGGAAARLAAAGRLGVDDARPLVVDGTPVDTVAGDGSTSVDTGAPRVTVLGQALEAVDVATAAVQVLALAKSGGGGLVVTMNVDHAVQLERPGALRDAYARATLRYADGMPIVWLAQLTGRPLPARVAGSDLVPLVLELAEQSGLRVHLVGGAPDVAAEAERRVLASYPDLQWTGHVSPPMGFDRQPDLDASIAAEVAAARPHIVLVCLGAPKQEAWALRHAEVLGSSVLLCVGATVDFLAGTQPRAPRWMVQLGMEWLFRLGREPRRLWRRYLVDDRRFLRLAVAEIVAEHAAAQRVRPLPGSWAPGS